MKNNNFVTVLFFTFIFKLCSFIVSSKMLDLNEGRVCRKGKGSVLDYVCMKPKNCRNLMKSLINRHFPEVCSFQGYQPIICCPITLNETSTVSSKIVKNPNSADEKCRQYSELKYSKILKVAIVGGTLANPQEFPHMVILGFGEKAEEGKWGCGGSLISDRWILTAAHCVANSWGKARWARVGDVNIIVTTDDARPKDYEIVQHVLHPDYKPPSRYNDIALFRLKTDVVFSAYVKPICLNTDPLLTPPKQMALATGWGRTSFVEKTSDSLLKVDLDIISTTQCNNSYFSLDNPQLKFGITPDSMICAGSDKGDRDTCVGDSGGPLQIKNIYNPSMYTQFGVTSFGKFCGDKDAPGVYTRVSKYISWIERVVWLITV